MFRKEKQAVITVEHQGNVKRATGIVSTEPLPIQLTNLVGVERISIVQSGKSIVVTAGNDESIINIEIKG